MNTRIMQGCRCALMFFVLCLAMLVSAAASAAVQVLRVDGIEGSAMDAEPPPDGSDFGEEGYLYLQDALDAARDHLVLFPSDTVQIWVRGRAAPSGPVVYRPDLGANVTENVRSESFHLHNSVGIYGGFSGTEAATTSGFRSRNPNLHRTVLSGEINNQSSTDDNSYHVVSVLAGPGNWIDRSARLDGFTITGGKADGNGFDGKGGGILIDDAGPAITRCIFEFNSGVLGGGAHVFHDAFCIPEYCPPATPEPIFVDCCFRENSAAFGEEFMWTTPR